MVFIPPNIVEFSDSSGKLVRYNKENILLALDNHRKYRNTWDPQEWQERVARLNRALEFLNEKM